MTGNGVRLCEIRELFLCGKEMVKLYLRSPLQVNDEKTEVNHENPQVTDRNLQVNHGNLQVNEGSPQMNRGNPQVIREFAQVNHGNPHVIKRVYTYESWESTSEVCESTCE